MSWNLALGRFFQLAPDRLKEISRGTVRCPSGCLLAHVAALDNTRIAIVFVHAENKAKEDGGLNPAQPTETSPYSVEELRRMSLQEFLGRMRERVITYRQLEGLYRQHGNVKRIAYVALKEDLAEGSPDAFSRCPHWSGNLPLSALNVSRRVTLITDLT